jgi:hypothetical protein
MIRATLTVNIGGADRVLKFGTNATALFCEAHGIGLAQMAELFKPESLTPAHYRDLIWSALKAGGTDCTAMEVGDWIDDMEQSEFDRIFASFEVAPAGKNGPKS